MDAIGRYTTVEFAPPSYTAVRTVAAAGLPLQRRLAGRGLHAVVLERADHDGGAWVGFAIDIVEQRRLDLVTVSGVVQVDPPSFDW